LLCACELTSHPAKCRAARLTFAPSLCKKDTSVMRILFSGTPGFGHLLPLLPLARAFRKQGDTVAFTTGEAFADLVAADGMDFIQAGPPLEVMLGEFIQSTGADPSSEVPPQLIAEFFAGIRVDRTYDEAIVGAREWRPDLIIGEVYDFVGPFLAAALDVPSALVAMSPPFGAEFDALMAEVASSRFADRGLVPSEPHWLLDSWPSLLQSENWTAPRNRLSLRPEAHHVAGWLPSASAAKTRPTVLVSFGTMHNPPAVVGPMLRELAKLDIDIKATTGPFPRSEFDVDADNVTFVDFTPLAELLQGVDVLVGNGGAGTTSGALAQSIPMVTVPLAADQFHIADRVEASGTGIVVSDAAKSPEAVAQAVDDILSSTPYRVAAKQVAEQIAGLNSPEAVAAQLRAAVQG
jgi:UDP:flavonoid glycosyltransferase YjiC (YdhE family)